MEVLVGAVVAVSVGAGVAVLVAARVTAGCGVAADCGLSSHADSATATIRLRAMPNTKDCAVHLSRFRPAVLSSVSNLQWSFDVSLLRTSNTAAKSHQLGKKFTQT